MHKIPTLIVTAAILGAVACFNGSEETVAASSSSPTASAPAEMPKTTAAITVTGSRIEISDASGSVGQVKTVRVLIFDAKTGISGYVIVVSVADPTVGRITKVSLPDFGLIAVGDLPAGSVDIMAADLPGLLEGDIKEARLATLEIEMLKAGTTDLLVEIHSVDDDEGNYVQSQVVSGTLSVN